MKVQMSLNDELLARADQYAKKNYLSRSALVTTALNQYLLANELSTVLTEMALCMRQISDKGAVDPETKKKIDELDVIAKMLLAKQ